MNHRPQAATVSVDPAKDWSLADNSGSRETFRASKESSGSVGEAPITIERIYLESARFVWLSLQRLGVRHADLDDVCHDVFIVVQRRFKEFDSKAAVRPWLFGICVRTAANYRRRSHNRRENSLGTFAEGEAVPEAPAASRPDSEAARRESMARAEAILNQMSAIKRAVFVMFELEGMSSQEIAEELGVPVGTVYSRLHAAREFFLAQANAKTNRSGTR